MEAKVRKTSIAVVGNVPWGTHFCQFYQTKQDLIDMLVPYFKAGLENNEFCMWVTSEPLNAENAHRALKKKVRNLDGYIKKGQIEILDYSQWYTKPGHFDSEQVLQGWVEKEKQALKSGFDGLRLSGNTFWLEKRDWRDFVEYEAAVNSIIGKYRMLAICTYCLEKCGASEIVDVVSNHQFALIKREARWEIIESAEHKKVEEELRRSEERYALAQRAANIGSWDWNILTGELVWSEQIEPMFGFGKGKFGRTYQAFLDCVHPEDRQFVMDSVNACVERGRGYAIEHRIVWRDGTMRWVSERGDVIRGEDGRAVRMLGIVQDITERKRAELEINKLNEELEQRVVQRTAELTRANEQLRQEIEQRKQLQKEILNISSREQKRIGQELHDSLGQQLTGIAIMSKLLERKLNNKSTAESADATEIAELANQAIEQARSLARGLHPVDLDAGGLMSALQKLATTTEQIFGVCCTFICDRPVDIDDAVVAEHLYRIAQEAVTNAVKHGQANNIRIGLASNKDNAVLVVASDGQDFPEVLPKGAGMGLQIMNYRAEMIDGSLDVCRGAKGGTVVTCVSPNKKS